MQTKIHHRKREYDEMGLFDLLLGPTRAVLLHDVLTLNMPLRCCLMYVPMFQQFWQMYSQLSQQVLSIPYGAISTLNQVIAGSPRIVKQFVGGLGIYVAIYLYYIATYITGTLIPNLRSDGEWIKDYLFYLQIITAIAYVLLYISEPGTIEHNWTQDQVSKLQDERPEFSTQRCLCYYCQKPKVARANHCPYCQKCVARYSEHNMVANVCIGACNYLQYLLFIFSITSYIVFSLYVFFQPYKPEFRGGLHNIILIIGLLYCSKYFVVKSLVLFNLTLHNLTEFEVSKWQTLPYLWKSELREYHNPFHLGIIGNIIELFVPLIQGKKVVKLGSSGGYEELDQDIELNNVSPSLQYSPEGFELWRGKYINWLNAKYYTVMDIPNDHPMKLKAYEELRKRGALTESATTDREMKLQWQQYMKKQIEEQKQQQMAYHQQMEQLRAQFGAQGQHQHQQGGGCCDHKQSSTPISDHQKGGQQNQQQQSCQQQQQGEEKGLSDEQMKQIRRQTGEEMQQMLNQRLQMFQNHQEGMTMEKQEDESGGLLADDDEHDD